MKPIIKILFILTTLMLAFQTNAAGDYDGVWKDEINLGIFGSFHQQGSTMIFIPLDPSTLEWEAYAGAITGTTASVSTIISEATANLEIEFTSFTEGVITIGTCSPAIECDFNPGDQIPIKKVF